MEQNLNVSPAGTAGLEPHRGTMILIFGIAGILCCGIFAILAWIFGNTDLEKMKKGVMDPSGESQTNTGRILGMIGVGLWVLGTIGYAIFFGFGIMSGFLNQ